MKTREIYRGTMPFVWAKITIGLLVIGIGCLLAVLLGGLAWMINTEEYTIILFLIWIVGMCLVRFIIMRYFGYLIKVGHIAVIVEAITSGIIPDNQVSYGKNKVKERFVTSNIYFVVNRLLSGAVRQIQKVVDKTGEALDFIPGMSFITMFLDIFIGISLGYVEGCCLGYTFYKDKQGACKSAADGIVIYAQNWKSILVNATKTTFMVMILVSLIFIISLIGFGMLFNALQWSSYATVIVSFCVAWAVKFAFIDTYILITTMKAYMEVAPTTEITYDLYGKLCHTSSKFKKLFNKGEAGN